MESQYPKDDGKGSSMMCRQSSTRWTPTTEQIRILKDLYTTTESGLPMQNRFIRSRAPSSSAGLVGNYGAHRPLGMEKSFRQDCSLSAGFNGGNGHGSLAMEKSFKKYMPQESNQNVFFSPNKNLRGLKGLMYGNNVSDNDDSVNCAEKIMNDRELAQRKAGLAGDNAN